MNKSLVTILAVFTLSSASAFDAEKLFNNTCAVCHTIGEGDKMGPDLAGVGKRRTVEWLVKFISYPSGMIEGDPEEKGYEKPDPVAQKIFAAYKPTTMPEQEITADQVKELIKFIDSKGKQPKGKILTIK